MRWCTNTIHDGVNQSLQLLDPVFSKVLMLVMRLALPIVNAVSAQDFLDLVTYLNLSTITYKLSRCSSCQDLVFQSVDEMPVSFNGINTSDKGFDTNKNLSDSSTRVNSWSVRIYGVHCHWLVSPVYIESGERRFIPLLKESAHGKASLLSGHSEGLLDHVSREPSKHGHKGPVVMCPLVDLMGLRLICGG